ncbi:MAG: hypothetical protein D6677_13805 [Calditrichaeota bacterium]|nr:MAG: hypothetical protein D6677_13805 [Calditrichota bacterium]
MGANNNSFPYLFVNGNLVKQKAILKKFLIGADRYFLIKIILIKFITHPAMRMIIQHYCEMM